MTTANKEEKVKKETQNDSVVNLSMCYDVVVEEEGKKEQRRTTENKKLFINIMEQAMGIVKVACEHVGITRKTYYGWVKEDPVFAGEMDRIRKEQLGDVEDRLLRAIANNEPWAITLYLNRKHPDYKPKSEMQVIPTERTLEDLIDEANKKNAIEAETKNNYDTDGQQNINREVIEDKNKEGGTNPVCFEQGAVFLLEAPNAQKHNIESETERD